MLKVIFRDFISGPLTCQNCKQELLADFQFVMEHCRICDFVSRPNQAYTFVCFQCDYHSRFESHMKRHVSVHLGVKPFKCDHCNYSSIEASKVHRHILIRHNIPT
uniref:RE1-silencing transcription factor n=1 Tax=Cacopsylla melanoneura TaxID=428564 RepID=A0A8D8YLR8_9HEMI